MTRDQKSGNGSGSAGGSRGNTAVFIKFPVPGKNLNLLTTSLLKDLECYIITLHISNHPVLKSAHRS
jgi:hypothetical protein